MKTGNIIATIIFTLSFFYIISLDKTIIKKSQAIANALISPFFKKSSEINKFANDIKSSKKTYTDLIKENNYLTQKVKALSIKRQDFIMQSRENYRLRQAINFKKRSELDIIAAEINIRDTSTWWNTIVINKGSDHGIYYGAPVLTERGLVGKIISTNKNNSTVILITDERCHVSSSIENTREVGILCGRIGGDNDRSHLILKYLNKDAKVKTNQAVYTQGIATFPANIKLGKIIKLNRGIVYTEAVIEPEVNFNKLNVVFVVISEYKTYDEVQILPKTEKSQHQEIQKLNVNDSNQPN